MIDRDYSEKRNYMRMNMDVPATVELADGSQHACTCRDLSAEGMLLELDQALTPGDELTVQVPAFSSQLSPLAAKATVTRVEDLGNGRYRMGVTIINLN